MALVDLAVLVAEEAGPLPLGSSLVGMGRVAKKILLGHMWFTC